MATKVFFHWLDARDLTLGFKLVELLKIARRSDALPDALPDADGVWSMDQHDDVGVQILIVRRTPTVGVRRMN
jgi:hypothetical protein